MGLYTTEQVTDWLQIRPLCKKNAGKDEIVRPRRENSQQNHMIDDFGVGAEEDNF